MADNVTVTLEGATQLLERLDGVIDNEKMKRALGKACAIVERSAKEKAPKGNGELRRSITSKVESDGGAPVGVVFTPLEYAPYVEFGTGLFAEEGGRQNVPWCYQDDEGNWHTTSGMKPQPYMRPALNENREQIKRILREGMVEND
jgi:HK97 gp10 family phage protein